ncbi:hypothetical protein DA803_00060 [[Mycoplasma] phocae]|uniref:Uncharacterized protein n=2 Tax=[Mycoplasma] phocae TaxID=142651 RepID=A0A2Z5IPJ0_9BACT|nr:hypothetical protein DA803_00060 [[Mycoplasma] phocae]
MIIPAWLYVSAIVGISNSDPFILFPRKENFNDLDKHIIVMNKNLNSYKFNFVHLTLFIGTFFYVTSFIWIPITSINIHRINKMKHN